MSIVTDPIILEDCLIKYKNKKAAVNKTKVVPFEIKFEEIEWPSFCPVFKFPLDYYNGVKKLDSPSFWLIDPHLGYVKDNVKIVSWKAKKVLGNSPLVDLDIIFNYIKSLDII